MLDAVRGRQGPFDPVELTKEYAALCRQYRVTSVTGDKYALEWVTSAWRNAGITYARSELTASRALPRGPAALHARPRRAARSSRAAAGAAAIGALAGAVAARAGTHPRGCHDDSCQRLLRRAVRPRELPRRRRLRRRARPRERQRPCGRAVLAGAGATAPPRRADGAVRPADIAEPAAARVHARAHRARPSSERASTLPANASTCHHRRPIMARDDDDRRRVRHPTDCCRTVAAPAFR